MARQDRFTGQRIRVTGQQVLYFDADGTVYDLIGDRSVKVLRDIDPITLSNGIATFHFTDGDTSEVAVGGGSGNISPQLLARITANETAIAVNTSAIALNTNKRSYPQTDQAKLAAIEPGATADQTAAEIKTLNESNPDTNAFTDAEKAKLAASNITGNVITIGNDQVTVNVGGGGGGGTTTITENITLNVIDTFDIIPSDRQAGGVALTETFSLPIDPRFDRAITNVVIRSTAGDTITLNGAATTSTSFELDAPATTMLGSAIVDYTYTQVPAGSTSTPETHIGTLSFEVYPQILWKSGTTAFTGSLDPAGATRRTDDLRPSGTLVWDVPVGHEYLQIAIDARTLTDTDERRIFDSKSELNITPVVSAGLVTYNLMLLDMVDQTQELRFGLHENDALGDFARVGPRGFSGVNGTDGNDAYNFIDTANSGDTLGVNFTEVNGDVTATVDASGVTGSPGSASVASDATLTGDGTSGSPLSVAYGTTSNTALEGNTQIRELAVNILPANPVGGRVYFLDTADNTTTGGPYPIGVYVWDAGNTEWDRISDTIDTTYTFTDTANSGTTLGVDFNVNASDVVTATVDASGLPTGSSLTVQDEGIALAGDAETLNFTGSGVTVTGNGTTKTVSIPGATGGATAFTGLTDTPGSYAGDHPGDLVVINSAGDGLDFVPNVPGRTAVAGSSDVFTWGGLNRSEDSQVLEVDLVGQGDDFYSTFLVEGLVKSQLLHFRTLH